MKKQILIYINKFIKESFRAEKKTPWIKSVKYFYWLNPWLKSNLDGKSPLEDEIPWITFGAIRFLEHYIQVGMKVFEYGSGGSTLFFLDRKAVITSIEHDPSWIQKVQERIANKGIHWSPTLVRPVPAVDFQDRSSRNPNDFISSDPEYQGYSFKDYVSTIQSYPDEYFDIILIDGRARPSCFMTSLEKIKKGGVIIWDNTDREEYWDGMKIAPPNFKVLDFFGPSPYVDFFTKTTVWINQA